MVAKRKAVDRERLELDYRTGLHTFKEMSATHGLTGPRIVSVQRWHLEFPIGA